MHVLVVGDGAHTRRHALLDVGVEARASEAGVTVELVLRARADRERAQEEVEGLTDRVGMGVGTEVAHALALGAPHHHGPGPFLVEGDGEVRVGLVVLQPDVEARAVLLDEVELEEEGLDLVTDGDPLDGVGGADHLHGAFRQAGREVRHHPATEALGLPHVDDPAGRVLELVRARRVGDRGGNRPLHSPIVAPGHRAARGMRMVPSGVMLAMPAWNSGTQLGSVADNPAVGDQAVPAGHERNPTPLGGNPSC